MKICTITSRGDFIAIRILLGGSPCTFWSAAKGAGREVEPSGVGWELFDNYRIAKAKFKPHFFLYENNKSAAPIIKEQILRELGGDTDPAVRLTHINSSLVSAQHRERFYVTNCGDIEQPEDRGILLKDIIEGNTDRDKARAVIGSIGRTTTREYFKKHQGTMVYEPVKVFNLPLKNGELSAYDSKQYRVYSLEGKGTALCGNGGGMGAKTGLV